MGKARRLRTIVTLLVGVMVLFCGQVAHAQDVAFTEAFLNDPTTITLGKQLWAKRCQFCHGKAAYPGSAPPLRPWMYTPEFIYERITNGFRGMPPLKQEFSEAERKAIVAYVLSRNFSP